jgi:cellulose synthase/poly-beta-1,6-N-acetylglucosamine synthase-like glycosyltransferase
MERTIERCLESILKTGYPNKEVVVVDDESTDRTTELLRKYPVRLIRVPHGGVSAARNAGLAQSEGDILAFTDADCYVDTDWLDELVKPFEASSNAGVGGYVDFEKTGIVATALSIEYGERFRGREAATTSVACINAAFRKEALKKVGGFRQVARESVGGEDIDLSYRLVEAGFRLTYTPRAVVHHDGREMSSKIVRRSFRNAVVSIAIFRKHRVHKDDRFFGFKLKAEPFVLGLSLLGALLTGVLGGSLWPVFLLLPLLWNAPLGVKTCVELSRLSPLIIVPAVFLVRSGAFLAGACWGAMMLLAHPVDAI